MRARSPMRPLLTARIFMAVETTQCGLSPYLLIAPALPSVYARRPQVSFARRVISGGRTLETGRRSDGRDGANIVAFDLSIVVSQRDCENLVEEKTRKEILTETCGRLVD